MASFKNSALLFLPALLLLSGCAQKGFDPCDEMMREVREVRTVEKQLAKTQTLVKQYTAAHDTADLNATLRIRATLIERRKSAQIAGDNMAAACLPKSDDLPLDPNPDAQEPKSVK